MKKISLCLVAFAAICLMAACDSKKPSEKASDAQTEDSLATCSDSVECNDITKGSYDYNKVEKWVITVTAVTSIYDEVSEEEAKRIEAEAADGDSELWVDYVEEEGKWYVHGNPIIEEGVTTITDAKIVKRLNSMMYDTTYTDYKAGVIIEGRVAHAEWYGGNRGGGIYEDFPSDLASYILDNREY